MITRLFTRLRAHLGYWAENYLFVPLILVALTMSIRYVGWITGRDVTEDVGAIPAGLVNLVLLVLICSVSGLIQKHMIGYRNEGNTGTFRDDVFDTVVFFALNAGFAYVVFFR